jgi:hypothetical protein
MEKKMEVCFTIKPIWETISNIRDDIQKVLKIKMVNEDTLEKADLVCLELLENAVKYGIVTPDCPDVKIWFELEEDVLVFYVSNGVRIDDKLQFLFELINKLRNAENVEALYIQRLEEITRNPRGGSQLGIYRIVFESGFHLRYTLEGYKLTIAAQKQVIREVV